MSKGKNAQCRPPPAACICGTPSIKWVIAGSGVTEGAEARAVELLSSKRRAVHLFKPGECPACTADKLTHHVRRAKTGAPVDEVVANLDADKHFGILVRLPDEGGWERRKRCKSFAFHVYSAMGRKAVAKTVELFRAIACLKVTPKWSDCVHECVVCEDHFEGGEVEVDHTGVEFQMILVAFLDAHVPDWLVPPDADTVAVKVSYGWKHKVNKSTKVELAETEEAYWQRVKNDAKVRWERDGLADKFVNFHNSLAALRVLCKTCHSAKSGRAPRFSYPVFCEELGPSKKRKRIDLIEAEELAKMKLEREKEEKELSPPFLRALDQALVAAIASMEYGKIEAALAQVPLILRNHFPMAVGAAGVMKALSPLGERSHITFHLPPTSAHASVRYMNVPLRDAPPAAAPPPSSPPPPSPV